MLTRSDVTVNLDGMWLLCALAGIATLAPELRTRPYGNARSDDWLHAHPGLEVLRREGLLDADDRLTQELADQLAVLAVPDVEVVVLVSYGAPMRWATADMDDPATWRSVPDEQLRIVLARRGRRWVSAVRAGEDITIDNLAGGDDSLWVTRLLFDVLDALHPCPPATMPAMTLPLQDTAAAVAQRAPAEAQRPGGHDPLKALGVRGAGLRQLSAVCEDAHTEAVCYARAHFDTEKRWSAAALNVRDTTIGRVLVSRMATVRGSSQQWLSIGPATATAVSHAMSGLLNVEGVAWNTHTRN